jgi:hypothetical protein
VRRGSTFCTTLSSNRSLNGRARMQYKLGSTWVTARTRSLSGVASWRQCASINRAGTFATRVYIDQLVHPTGGWSRYNSVAKSTGTVRVNNLFRIVR